MLVISHKLNYAKLGGWNDDQSLQPGYGVFLIVPVGGSTKKKNLSVSYASEVPRQESGRLFSDVKLLSAGSMFFRKKMRETDSLLLRILPYSNRHLK